MISKKDRIRKLLKGIETGDPESVTVVNEDNYIRHNPLTPEGSEGLAELFKRLSQTSPRVNIQYNRMNRILAEGNFSLSVSEGFRNGVHSSFYDLFRVADDKLVEHWDTTEAVPPRTEWKNDNGKF